MGNHPYIDENKAPRCPKCNGEIQLQMEVKHSLGVPGALIRGAVCLRCEEEFNATGSVQF